jgi:hypothetical protein
MLNEPSCVGSRIVPAQMVQSRYIWDGFIYLPDCHHKIIFGTHLGISLPFNACRRDGTGWLADNHSTGAVIDMPAVLSLKRTRCSCQCRYPIEQERTWVNLFYLPPENHLQFPGNHWMLACYHRLSAYLASYSALSPSDFSCRLPISRAAVPQSPSLHTKHLVTSGHPESHSESKPRTCHPFSELFASHTPP